MFSMVNQGCVLYQSTSVGLSFCHGIDDSTVESSQYCPHGPRVPEVT